MVIRLGPLKQSRPGCFYGVFPAAFNNGFGWASSL